MARKVGISGASVGVTGKANTAPYEAVSDIGNAIKKSVGEVGKMYKQSQDALSKSQIDKNGTLQNDSWKTFNAQNKGNYNEDDHIQKTEELYTAQRGMIDDDKDLTDTSRKFLISNLDGNVSSALTNFKTNQAYAMSKAAVENTNEGIAYQVRDGNADNAKAIYEGGVETGVYSGDDDSRDVVYREIDTNVSFYNDEDEVSDILNGDTPAYISQDNQPVITIERDGVEVPVTRMEALTSKADVIDNNPNYSTAQRNNLLSQVSQAQRVLSKSQADYLKRLDLRMSSGADPKNAPTQADFDMIENPVQQKAYQIKFDNWTYGLDQDRITAEGKESTTESKINAARGKLFAKMGKDYDKTEQNYFGYSPAWDKKKSKKLVYNMTPREHLGITEYNLNSLESMGTIVNYMDKDEILSGKRALDTMWHEVNAITDDSLREAFTARLIEVQNKNTALSYRMEPSTINTLPEPIQAPINAINEWAETNFPSGVVGNGEMLSAYNNGIKFIYESFKYDPDNFVKNKESIIEHSMKGMRMVKSKENLRASLLPSTPAPNVVNWSDL